MEKRGKNLQTIRIALVDDHHVVRTAVAHLLSRNGKFEIVADIAEGGSSLFQAVDRLNPDLLLLDAYIPGYDLVQDVHILRKRHPDLPILILSAYERHDFILGLLRAGALGYVHKGDPPHMLLSAIRTVARGSEWISPKMASILLDTVRNQDQRPASILTPRELEVLQALATGATNSEIADELFITEQTVKNHASRIFKKLGVETRVKAVLYALRHGLASPDH